MLRPAFTATAWMRAVRSSTYAGSVRKRVTSSSSSVAYRASVSTDCSMRERIASMLSAFSSHIRFMMREESASTTPFALRMPAPPITAAHRSVQPSMSAMNFV